MTPYMLSWAVLARSSAAAFLAWPQGNQQLLDSRPLETGQLDPNGISSWAPMTTDPPSVKHLTTQAEPRGLLSEDDLNSSDGNNSWLNSKTCGWFTGHPSSPFTCDDGWTCSTDTNYVVGCTTTNYFPSFAICYDYEAQRSGRCSSLGALTGCCSFSDYPACGTFLWVESTPRSMLRCMTSTTIISINDHPQFVVNAAVTTSATTATTSNLVPLSTISNGAGSSGGGGGGGGGGGIHIGAFIAAIGGVIAMILVLLLVLFCVYRKRDPNGRHRQDDDGRPVISAPIPMTDLPAAAFAQQVPISPRDPATGEMVLESPAGPCVWSRSRARAPSLDGMPHEVPVDREA